jgi:3-phosphoshikimate 1-carboxyvinyltransferase
LAHAAQERLIRPARNIIGSLRLPGDKSISHRYAMLAGFAEGTSRFTNFSTGADCASTLACMADLGAKVNRIGPGSVEITGVAGRVTPPAHPLDCGNSGSTMRMISGLLAPQAGRFTLIGDASLSRRPMERIRKPLEAMGARLTLTDGHAPLMIDGGSLHAIDYTIPVPSAQVKSCILFAALQTAGTTTVREETRTRDHSELALRAFGAKLTRTSDSISIAGPQGLCAIDAAVPRILPLRRCPVPRLQPRSGLDRPQSHARHAARRSHRPRRACRRLEYRGKARRAGRRRADFRAA